MSIPNHDWQRLLDLLDSYFELEEDERLNWLGQLSGTDRALRPQLEKLIAQRSQLLRQEFLATPAALPAEAVASPVPSDATTRSPATLPAGVDLSPDPPPPAVGMVLGRNFKLLEELGRGGMGRVFKAEDLIASSLDDSNPFVAVKVLSPEFKKHPDAEKALQQETARARTLAHPNVITVGQFDRDGPYSYMTMEYLRGQTLDGLITENPQGMSYQAAWKIIKLICAALEYGHTKVYENKRGIVHSDLKPNNVFVCKDGNVKVLDFGISRPMPANADATVTTQFDPGKRLRALTPAYAALEMWDFGVPDPRDDIYALGCLSYELLTGHHPFERGHPVEKCSAQVVRDDHLTPARIQKLDGWQWGALRKTLALRRADRTRSVAEFVRQFAPRSFVRRHALALAVGAVAVIAGVLLVGADYFRAYIEQEMGPVKVHRHAGKLTNAQLKQVADYVTQANENLRAANASMSPEDLSYVLSDGANNVYEIAEAALAIDPNNEQAQRIEAGIARLYEQKARAILSAGPASQALALVKAGLKVQPYDLVLKRLQNDICGNHDDLCAIPAAQ